MATKTQKTFTPATETKADNGALTYVSSETQIDAIKKVLGKTLYNAYDSYETFAAAFVAARDATDNFYDLSTGVVGGRDITDPDAWDCTNNRIAYQVIRAQMVGENGKKAGVLKSLLIYQEPRLDLISASEIGIDFLQTTISKEIRLRLARGIRTADTMTELANDYAALDDSIEYIASLKNRGADDSAFSAIYDDARKAYLSSYAVLKASFPGKADLIRGIRSKSFAMSPRYVALEQLNGTDTSVFVHFAEYIVDSLEGNDLDSTAVRDWIDGRETLELTPPKEVDESALSALVLS